MRGERSAHGEDRLVVEGIITCNATDSIRAKELSCHDCELLPVTLDLHFTHASRLYAFHRLSRLTGGCIYADGLR